MRLHGTILITGGTGSLGHAIMRRANEENWDTDFIVYSRDESKQARLRSVFPDIRCVLGDVRDEDWLRLNMRGVDTVIHAGAYKRVPSAQNNATETVKTNIIGSLNVARAAVEAGVRRVVGISTDKAAQPVNVYGASKFVMESLFQNADRWGDTVFTLARYGNVVGSNGSVIPFFVQQALSGEYITVTHKNMTRFWITMNEAVDLILFAHTLTGGNIVVPRAPAMRVWDLAETVRDMYAPTIEVVTTSIRPGEKIHECMVTSAESYHTHVLPKFFVIIDPTRGAQSVGNMEPDTEYTSDKPDRWLSHADMEAYILEWEKLSHAR